MCKGASRRAHPGPCGPDGRRGHLGPIPGVGRGLRLRTFFDCTAHAAAVSGSGHHHAMWRAFVCRLHEHRARLYREASR
eukprot:4551214-Prymnesium_polylepis.1